jgi:hypothetical protein
MSPIVNSPGYVAFGISMFDTFAHLAFAAVEAIEDRVSSDNFLALAVPPSDCLVFSDTINLRMLACFGDIKCLLQTKQA